MPRVETKTLGFQEVIQAIQGATRVSGKAATGGLVLGQVRRTQERTALNAAMVLALDQKQYSNFIGRDMDYINIPVAGQFVLNRQKHVILDIIREHFESQESPSGQPWADLRESTLAWRKAQGYPSGPILQASGELYRAVQDWGRDEDFFTTTVVGKNSRLVIGIEDLPQGVQQKAWVHNIGGPWGWPDASGTRTNIPARPFIPNDTGDFNAGERKRIKAAARAGWNEYAGTTLDRAKAKKNAQKARRG